MDPRYQLSSAASGQINSQYAPQYHQPDFYRYGHFDGVQGQTLGEEWSTQAFTEPPQNFEGDQIVPGSLQIQDNEDDVDNSLEAKRPSMTLEEYKYVAGLRAATDKIVWNNILEKFREEFGRDDLTKGALAERFQRGHKYFALAKAVFDHGQFDSTLVKISPADMMYAVNSHRDNIWHYAALQVELKTGVRWTPERTESTWNSKKGQWTMRS